MKSKSTAHLVPLKEGHNTAAGKLHSGTRQKRSQPNLRRQNAVSVLVCFC